MILVVLIRMLFDQFEGGAIEGIGQRVELSGLKRF